LVRSSSWEYVKDRIYLKALRSGGTVVEEMHYMGSVMGGSILGGGGGEKPYSSVVGGRSLEVL